MYEIKAFIKENLKNIIKEVYDLDLSTESISLEKPKDSNWGELSSNISFVLSKSVKQSPVVIAKELSYRVTSLAENLSINNKNKFFSEVYSTDNGFINFRIEQNIFTKNCIDVLLLGNHYGVSKIGENRSVIVEYSQPNSNKPQHVGHARNNFIGSAVAAIFSACGYDVTKSNYVGDIGIHICKSMLMYQKYGEGRHPDKKSDHFVGDFYIMYEKEEAANPEIIKEAQELLRRWETNDPEVHELWKKMNSWVYEGWKQTYSDQNVDFDIWEYESQAVAEGKDIAELAVELGLAEKDETGAIIARLEKYNLPDKVLLRSDGTSVYSTKDLQLAKNSYEKYQFFKRFYVVDNRQADYFKQIFKILELLGFDWAKNLINLAYGYVTLPEGPMSSRKGRVVNADDIFYKLIELEKTEILQSKREVENLDETAKKVALAAFRYGMLKVDIYQDLVFDYEKMSKFDGNTGPYLMYSYARAQSILRKADISTDKLKNVDPSFSKSLPKEAVSLIKDIALFPEVLEQSALKYAPNILCNYLFDLSQKFNSFYAAVPIIKSEDPVTKNILFLITAAFSQTLKNGLNLLKIDVVEKM